MGERAADQRWRCLADVSQALAEVTNDLDSVLGLVATRAVELLGDGGAVFLAFNITWQSLAFWLGNAEGLASQMWQALLTFATYPPPLFRGLVKGLLFTALPAAFISHVPVQLLREFDAAGAVPALPT